jgi:hypothetical protein
MRTSWDQWQSDLLERERAFERPHSRLTEPVAPWELWDWAIAAFVVLTFIGFFVAMFGDLTA